MKIPAIFLAFLLFLSSNSCFSQSTEDRKLKLAQSYQQSGDFKNSARIFKELYDANKVNPAYFQGLKQSYFSQNQFSSILPLIEEQLTIRKTPEMYALLGNVHWRLGKTVEADKSWADGIEISGKTEAGFVLITQAQIDNRLYDKAIATLLKGRSVIGNPASFSADLCQLYATVENYTEGVKEVLSLLHLSNNLALAQGKTAAFLVTEKGVQQTQKFIAEAANNDSHNIMLLQLYGWLLREIKQYDKAFPVYEQIDKDANAQGREILAYAEVALREDYLDAALKAFSAVIEKGKSNPFVGTALFGYARTMEAKMSVNSKFTQKDLDEIVKQYRNIIEDYPQTPFSAESQYRLAVLFNEQMNNPKQAIEEFKKLLANYKMTQVAAKGAVELGNVYVQLGEISKAREVFETAAKTYTTFPNEREKSLFQLAEIEYFEGNLDSAQDHYGKLASNSNADIANDALTRIALLQDCKTDADKSALKIYAKAEWSERQKKQDDAIQLFLKSSETAPKSVLADECFFRAAKIEFSRQKYVAGREYLNSLLSNYPESIWGDDAYLLMGDSFAEEKNKDEAIKSYTKILELYPRSTLLNVARLKIRKLRGDA